MNRNDRYILLAMFRIVAFVGTVVVAAFTSGCERESSPQPPNILYGQQECDECRMIINDDRYAAAIVLADADGAYQSVAFDDIGCLLQYEQSNSEQVVAARYVREHSSRNWLDAESAIYVHSTGLETPMAFGLAAFAERSGGEQLAGELSAATIIDWPTVRERFAKNMFDTSCSQRGDATMTTFIERRIHSAREIIPESVAQVQPDEHENEHLAHHFETPVQQFEAAKLGMWLFLATEVLLFGGLFCLYAVFRHTRPEIFGYGSRFLDTQWGAINTVVLILSSMTMAWAVRCAQLNQRKRLVTLLALTILGGATFMR